jgi:hypothetical protein
MIPTNYLRFCNKKVEHLNEDGSKTYKSYKILQQKWEIESPEEAMDRSDVGLRLEEWRDVPEVKE